MDTYPIMNTTDNHFLNNIRFLFEHVVLLTVVYKKNKGNSGVRSVAHG